tara:strand:- start:36 stop:341 length:306 start_codon:yes stop_codon:yes gene_type:complete
MASIGGIMQGAFKAFMGVAKGVTKIPPLIISRKPEGGMTAGPVGSAIYKFLKFSLYSSIVLIFFMMGGMFFSAFALLLVYYKLFIKIGERDQEIKDIEAAT